MGSAHIRLAQAKIPHDAQRAVPAHRGAHVQMPVGTGRKIHQRMAYAALYAARAIGHGNQHSKGAVAFHPQGNGIIRTFQHNAHHAGSRQQAAQRRACHRSGVVNLFHALYQRRAIHSENTTPPSSDKARTMFFSSIAIFSCKSMERHYCLSD